MALPIMPMPPLGWKIEYWCMWSFIWAMAVHSGR